jgi:hypothetical protein
VPSASSFLAAGCSQRFTRTVRTVIHSENRDKSSYPWGTRQWPPERVARESWTKRFQPTHPPEKTAYQKRQMAKHVPFSSGRGVGIRLARRKRLRTIDCQAPRPMARVRLDASRRIDVEEPHDLGMLMPSEHRRLLSTRTPSGARAGATRARRDRDRAAVGARHWPLRAHRHRSQHTWGQRAASTTRHLFTTAEHERFRRTLLGWCTHRGRSSHVQCPIEQGRAHKDTSYTPKGLGCNKISTPIGPIRMERWVDHCSGPRTPSSFPTLILSTDPRLFHRSSPAHQQLIGCSTQ